MRVTRRLRATVSAEGPTRVLTVVDLEVHPPGGLWSGGLAGLVRGGGGGGSANSISTTSPVDWRAWSARGSTAWWHGAVGPAAPRAVIAASLPGASGALAVVPQPLHPLPAHPPPPSSRVPPPLLDVALHLAGVGLSLVGPSTAPPASRSGRPPAPAVVELAYVRLGGLRARAAHDGARAWAEVALGRAQVDDARPWTAHPVVLVTPVELGGLLGVHYSAVGDGSGSGGGGGGGGGVATAAPPALGGGGTHSANSRASAPPPALRARLAAWMRRPDGVLCIETAEADASPLALNVEQAFAMAVAGGVGGGVAAGRAGFARLTGGPGRGGGPAGPPLPAGSRLEGSVAPSGRGESMPPPVRGRASPARGASVAPTEGGGGGDAPGEMPASTAADIPPPEAAAPLKVYADAIRVGPVRAILSLHPAAPQAKAAVVAGEVRRRRAVRAGGGGGGAPYSSTTPSSSAPSPGVQTVLALVGEVEGAHVTLGGLTLRHPLLGPAQLRQAVAAHYARAAVPVIVKLVGSASVLGDPAQLLAHLGMGLWALAAAPAAGLAAAAAEAAPGESPLAAASRAVLAAASGVRASAAHAVFGLSNAAAKGTATARAALDVLGLEGALAGLRQQQQAGGGGGSSAIGTSGGLLGAARGAAAALAAPAAAALDMSAAAAAALRAAAVGEPPRFARVRPPRRVDGRGRPLPPYDWHEAAGTALLRELPLPGVGGGETYLECRRAVVVLGGGGGGGGEGGGAAAAAVRASEPGAARPAPPPAAPTPPLLLPGRLVLVTESRILVAPVRPPPPPHGMRALAAAAAGAAAAAAAAHHHQFQFSADGGSARRPGSSTAAAPTRSDGGRSRVPDWAAATADVAGVRVVAGSAAGDRRLRRVEVLAFSPAPVGVSAAAAAGGGGGGGGGSLARPGTAMPRRPGLGHGLGFGKPFRSVVLECESEADARALAAALEAAVVRARGGGEEAGGGGRGGGDGSGVVARRSSIGGGGVACD